MKKYLPVLIILAALATGCGTTPEPTPTSTPDMKATEAAMLANVLATLTASAPTDTATPTATETFTQTPTSTSTGTPTASSTPSPSPTPSQTSTNTATKVPTPTPSPTATLRPVALPDHWQFYDGITDEFTVAYDPSWSIQSEGIGDVSFSLPGFAGMEVGFYRPECSINVVDDLSTIDSCMVDHIHDLYSSLDRFRLVGFDIVNDGNYDWFYAEYIVVDYVYDTADYYLHAYRADQDSDTMVACIYFRVDVQAVSDDKRRDFWQVASTFRVGTEHVPREQATPTCTPLPTATPPTYQTGEWIEFEKVSIAIIEGVPYELQIACSAAAEGQWILVKYLFEPKETMDDIPLQNASPILWVTNDSGARIYHGPRCDPLRQAGGAWPRIYRYNAGETYNGVEVFDVPEELLNQQLYVSFGSYTESGGVRTRLTIR